jgi:pyruvoyl-dependent arginine decarboxylase (PvlArgDC)
MTGIGGCAVVRLDLAVYVLGAIGPADRALVDQHLASCRRCQEELAGLAGLPALLGKVPAAEAARICGERATAEGTDRLAPGMLLDTMLGRVARVRRHRRRRLAAAAAVLVAAAAAAWGPQLLHPAAQPPPPPARQWAATASGFSPKTRAAATVRYTARAWGTELGVHVTGIPAGTTCQFWVVTSRGQDVDAGGWVIIAGQQHVWYPASTPVRVTSLRGFEVTSAGKILVTVQAHPASAPPHTPGSQATPASSSRVDLTGISGVGANFRRWRGFRDWSLKVATGAARLFVPTW